MTKETKLREIARKIAAPLRQSRNASGRDWRYGTVQEVGQDGTVLVLVDGNDEPTPCSATAVATAAGHRVAARVTNGRGEVLRDYSDPAAGAASVAEARAVADEAAEVAGATGQHFWESDDGAHVTQVPREEFEDDPDGPNLLANALGILLRNGLNYLVSIAEGAIAFFDGTGNTAADRVARLGADGTVIGYESGFHSYTKADGFGVANADSRLFDVSAAGGGVQIYAGGSAAAEGYRYTNAQLESLREYFQSQCTVVDGKVLDDGGNETGYTIDTSQSVTQSAYDADGAKLESGRYSALTRTTIFGIWALSSRATPKDEPAAMPFSCEFGGADVQASNGYVSARSQNFAVSWDGDVSLGKGGYRKVSTPSEFHIEVANGQATRYRFCFTLAGNIRLEQSTDYGENWTVTHYFNKSSV